MSPQTQRRLFDVVKTSKPTKYGVTVSEAASAMQKEIRKGDERAAVYWALVLAEAAPSYAWKRIMVTAAEDVGIGAPDVVAQVYALALGWKMCKDGSWYVSPHAITLAVMLLCRAPKDTTAGLAGGLRPARYPAFYE